MDGELMHYNTGRAKPARTDREVAAAAKEVYDRVRLEALKAQGAMALGGFMMEGLAELDARRARLENGNPILQIALSEIFGKAINQCHDLQDDLYRSRWPL
jgi:hypothetical protein